MIFELSNNLFSLGGNFPIKETNGSIFCNVDFMKGGILIYNKYGKLISQLYSKKDGVNIAIADSSSMFVNKNFDILPIETNTEDKKFISAPDEARKNIDNYFLFGAPKEYHYELFLKLNKQIKPVNVASIQNDLWDEEKYKVAINEDCNILKVISIILAIGVINMGGIK
jgi:hypothetical protein